MNAPMGMRIDDDERVIVQCKCRTSQHQAFYGDKKERLSGTKRIISQLGSGVDWLQAS
jgi:hypothetical protein